MPEGTSDWHKPGAPSGWDRQAGLWEVEKWGRRAVPFLRHGEATAGWKQSEAGVASLGSEKVGVLGGVQFIKLKGLECLNTGPAPSRLF